MAVVLVNKTDFKKEVLDNKGLVFVDFYADWCAPCKVTGPIIDQLSEEMKNIKFVKVNVDENADLAATYSIFSIPTFMIFNDGRVAHQFVGAMGKESFLSEIKKATG